MTIGYDVAPALPRLQREAESLMTLTLTAYSPTTPTEVNGRDVPAFISEGTTPGKVQGGSSSSKDTATRYVSIGGAQRAVMEGGLHIPIGAPLPTPSEERGKGWEYVVTAVGTADDPALLSRRYLVVGVPAKSFATARRLDVIEL